MKTAEQQRKDDVSDLLFAARDGHPIAGNPELSAIWDRLAAWADGEPVPEPAAPMTATEDGIVHYTCTRIQMIDALAALPLGGYLNLEARGRFADCILAQLPEASPDPDSYEEGAEAERERAALLAEEHGVSYARNIPGGEFEYWSFADLIRQETRP